MLLFTILGIPGQFALVMSLVLISMNYYGKFIARKHGKSNSYWIKKDPRKGDYNSMISQGRGHSAAAQRYARLDMMRRV